MVTSLPSVLFGSPRTKKYLPSSSELAAIEESKALWTTDMPFCGRWIASYYKPCVPSRPTEAWAAADGNFPAGRLIGRVDDGPEDVTSIRNKDKWVEGTVAAAIQSRIDLEKENRQHHYFRYGTMSNHGCL